MFPTSPDAPILWASILQWQNPQQAWSLRHGSHTAELLYVSLISRLSMTFSVLCHFSADKGESCVCIRYLWLLFRAATGSKLKEARKSHTSVRRGVQATSLTLSLSFLLLPQSLAGRPATVPTESVRLSLVRRWVPQKLDHLCCIQAAAQWLKKPTSQTASRPCLVLIRCQLAKLGYFV